MKWLERKDGEEKNVKPSIISNVYQDIKGYEEANDDDTTTTDLDEETNTNKSHTDEEIETIMPLTTTAIGPPIESGKELRHEIRGIDIGQELMPGCTQHQTRDAIQLVEENFYNFFCDCALMSAVTNTTQKLSMLRSIMNQSSTMTDNIMTNNTMTTMIDNTMNKEMPTYDRAIRIMKKSRTNNILRGANRYGVLEDSDDHNEVQNV